jgi:ribosomal protein L7Ae-like RNA K-turn-binding protein
MVIIATNLEKVEEAGGTDEIVSQIALSCRRLKIPLIYSMNRYRLGCATKFKGQLVSAVGIRNF